MHQVYFYRNPKGEQPVLEYMRELAKHKDKITELSCKKFGTTLKLYVA